MAEARSRAEWDRTASILCLMANIKRDPKKKPKAYRLSDFHPHHQKAAKLPKVKLSEVREMLGSLARPRPSR
jgi:hypothetical protein